MKIITRKKQVEIAKQLAAIYYTAVHWQDEYWKAFVKCIIGNCADIAFTVGGERMMLIDVPALVRRMELNRRLHKAEEGNVLTGEDFEEWVDKMKHLEGDGE